MDEYWVASSFVHFWENKAVARRLTPVGVAIVVIGLLLVSAATAHAESTTGAVELPVSAEAGSIATSVEPTPTPTVSAETAAIPEQVDAEEPAAEVQSAVTGIGSESDRAVSSTTNAVRTPTAPVSTSAPLARIAEESSKLDPTPVVATVTDRASQLAGKTLQETAKATAPLVDRTERLVQSAVSHVPPLPVFKSLPDVLLAELPKAATQAPAGIASPTSDHVSSSVDQQLVGWRVAGVLAREHAGAVELLAGHSHSTAAGISGLARPNGPLGVLAALPSPSGDAAVGLAPERSNDPAPGIPLQLPAPSGAAGGSLGTSFFIPFAALLALLALAAPAISRRHWEPPAFVPPTPFVCGLERPG